MITVNGCEQSERCRILMALVGEVVSVTEDDDGTITLTYADGRQVWLSGLGPEDFFVLVSEVTADEH